MKFKRIFVPKGDCRLWSTYEPPDGTEKKRKDVFGQLFDRWTDTAYLFAFFKNNVHLLADPFWRGMSVDMAVDKILDEASDFELELKNIETRKAGFGHLCLADIFKPFDKDSYVLDRNNLYHKKGKPSLPASMLRIYACEFDHAFIVTGGIIKLTQQLEKNIVSQEKAKMNAVLQYLKSEQVFTRDGLDEL